MSVTTLSVTTLAHSQDLTYDAVLSQVPLGPPPLHDQLIAKLVSRLQTLPVPRSLVELGISDPEYEELLRWGASLSNRRVHEALFWGLNRYLLGAETWTANEFVGIGLFMLITEIARRHATEGCLWPSIIARLPACRNELFTGNDQPAQLLKDSLEAAARKAQLRHVFGSAGTQEWYLSVYLQFGFTESGIERIPYWLAGYPATASIRILLGDDPEFSDRISDTFQQLWVLLQEVRSSSRKPEHAKVLLTLCPFILPRWIEPLLFRAQSRVDTAGQQSQADTILLFDTPSLKWPAGGRPYLMTRPRNLAWANLDPVSHSILIDSQLVGYIGYGDDGHHSAPAEIVLPDRTGTCLVELQAEGQSVYQQEVELWSSDEDIAVFRSSAGKRINAFRDPLNTREPYYVATAPDVKLSPEPNKYYRSNTLPVHFYELRPPWSEHLGATLEGYDIWKPVLTRDLNAEPDWARDIRIIPAASGRARVDALPPALIRQVRIGRTRFPPDAIQYALVSPKEQYTVTISAERQGQKAIIRRLVQGEPLGLERADDGWRRIGTRLRMTTAEAEQLVIKVIEHSDEELFLMAGHVLIKRLKRSATHIGRVSSFGQPLGVFAGRFNGAQLRYTIAKALEDTGVIMRIQRNFGAALLTLRQHIDLTPKHAVMILGLDGTFTAISPNRIQVRDRQWLVQSLSPEQENGWIAIAFKNERLGAAWPEAPLRAQPLNTLLSAEKKAAFLRWFRIPICASDILPVVRRLVHSKPPACLRMWLAEEGFQSDHAEELRFGNDAGEEWWAAVREACWDWRHTNRGLSEDILSAVSGCDSPFTVGCGVIRRADPLLAYRIMRPILLEDAGWLDYLDVTLPGEEYLRMLREESQAHLRADAFFLDDLVRKALLFSTGGAVQTIDQDNLKLALHSDAFRQYLFLRLCEDQYGPS